MKDAQLNNLLEKQKVLQQQLEDIRGQVPGIRQENFDLIQERSGLEKQVELQSIQMRELQHQLENLRSQTSAERKVRVSAAFKMTENIAQEREDLVKELELLRSINAKMLDDKDSQQNPNMVIFVQKYFGEETSFIFQSQGRFFNF